MTQPGSATRKSGSLEKGKKSQIYLEAIREIEAHRRHTNISKVMIKGGISASAAAFQQKSSSNRSSKLFMSPVINDNSHSNLQYKTKIEHDEPTVE